MKEPREFARAHLTASYKVPIGSIRSLRVSVLVATLSLGLGGCATATLTSGTNLAKAGEAAAQQMQQNATISADSMTALRRAVAFNTGYNKGAGADDAKAFLDNMTSIQGRLSQYSKLLASLSASYSALGDLSAYDASGTFNSSMQTLVGDSTKFAAAVGSPITVPANVTQGLSTVGSLAIGAIQAQRVKDGSAKIEHVLKQIIGALDQPATRDKLVPVPGKISDQVDQAAIVLLKEGVYSYGPILDQLGAPMGLKSTSGSDAAIAKDDNARAGLLAVAGEMAAEQSAQLAASYDKSLAALKALVPMHDSLEKGAPVDLSQIASVTGQLQTIAASLQTTTSTSPAKGK